MRARYRLFLFRCIPWLLACFVAPLAFGQGGLSATDTREISAYVLTESALSNYTRAANALSKLGKIPGLCNDDEIESLAAMVERINGLAAARNAITGAGMTTREFVLFTWATVANAVAALAPPGRPIPEGASKANIDFYRAHAAAFQAIPKSKDCGDDDER